MKLFILSLLFLGSQCAEIYVHLMPWFETPETNDGTWGAHWTMATRDPDQTIDGKQDIASFFHPVIGPYASSDPDVIDWQLGIMKVAGISGVFIDWPGTYSYDEYAQDLRNAEAIMEGTRRAGLNFAIVYEDINLILEAVDNETVQAIIDLTYVQDHYISQENYVQVDGKPLVLDYGPQALYGDVWDTILEPIDPEPAFITLWNEHLIGGSNVQGEFAWISNDFLDGLTTWYGNNLNLPYKIGVAYPGFQPFYSEGGWVGPSWTIDYGPDTFQQTLDLALANTDIIQISTWNDYGEGTVIEPTDEYNTTFVDIIQQALGSKYTHEDFEKLTEIYFLRKQNAKDSTVLENLKMQYHELVHRFD